jgi:hypothetical protein
MKKCVVLSIAFVPCMVCCYSIVLVHIGKELPSFAYESLCQARLFNKSCAIYLLASKQAIEKSDQERLQNCMIVPVSLESLHMSEDHKKFLKESPLSTTFREGFWLYASERFMYLADFVDQYEVEDDLVHLETDVMIYADFSMLVDTLHDKYPGLGVTLDNDARCIPSIVYFRNSDMVKKLAHYFAEKASWGKTDMDILAMFYHANFATGLMNTLPIIMPEYYKQFGFVSPSGHRTQCPQRYYNNCEAFDGIFDACAIGQYLGGIDPRNGTSKPGFINESALFNCSHLSFYWELDSENRRVPYVKCNEKEYKVYNLHIHSKNLKAFSSINVNNA